MPNSNMTPAIRDSRQADFSQPLHRSKLTGLRSFERQENENEF